MRRARVLFNLSGCVLCLAVALSLLPCVACAQEREASGNATGADATSASTRTQELQPVRVGFFAFDGYHMMDEDGMRSGYGYEYLQHMVGYTDWRYEYIGYDKSWNEMQDMLADGEIDLLTSAQKTEERLARFDFSDEEIGTSSAILTAKAGDMTYMVEDYDNWNGMRVGMIVGNSRNDGFVAYAEEHGFTYEPVFFSDANSMTAALRAGGQIDAMLTSNLRAIDGEWILAQFDPAPFYVMVRKGDAELLSEVNAAIEQLDMDEPDLRSQLMNRYYTSKSADAIAFTAAERAFIEDMQDTTFTAIINPDQKPFSSFENGEAVGIISDLANEFIARSGLNVEIIETADRADYTARAQAGDVDIRFDARTDYAEAEQMGYRLTTSYLDVSIAKVYLRGTTEQNSFALVKDSEIANTYGDFSGAEQNATYYDTVDEAVDAVLSGKQDAAYLYSRTATLALQSDVTNQLVTEPVYGYSTSFAVATNVQEDPRLFSILNKVVASISQTEIESIIGNNMMYQDEPFSLVGFMYDNPVFIMGMLCIVFIILVLVVFAVLMSRKRKQEQEQLVEEKRRNELLADALAAAEKADAAKSQFLSRVSHEMRTPLNAIIGFMTLAKKGEGQEISDYLANSDIAAKQLLAVINDVLDMSSIESGKMKLLQAPFDFKHMMRSISSTYFAECSQKGLEYSTSLLTPVDEWFIGDQLRVNQVLMNLLSNAVKFTSEGHVWLKVSQHDTQNKRVFVRFEVSDTGCGMSEEMQQRLFKPFEQESANTAAMYGGSGLGLSIVKSLVAMMDGAIRVESARGVGTTFTVDLPFTKSEAVVGGEVLKDVEDLHVLAVDDTRVECDYLSTVLERMGVRHTCMENAAAALEALDRAVEEGDAYNVCLIDWKMPDMNGIEMTQRVREKYGEDVIVIVISAYDYSQHDAEAREAGANLFISKPLFPSSLFNLFMSLTGGRITKNDDASFEADFSGRRILLAEDNEMNQAVAVGLLEKLGLACEVAEDGQVAVDTFTASEPGYYDAILMDIQMPNVDGFEATRMIRGSSHAHAQGIPIIALTANAFDEDVARALSNGMDAHVSKPIDVAALVSVLTDVFERSEELHDG